MMEKWRSYPGSIRLMAIAAVISSTGMACIWPLVTIYIHDHLGKPLTVAGFLLMLNQGAFLVGSVIGGMMFDRWGKLRTLVIASSGIIGISVALGLTQDFTMYTILLLLNGLFYGMLSPVINALAVVLWPQGGRKGLNMIYVAQNAGVAAGAALGGLLASVSFAWTFFGNAITQSVALILFVLILPRYLNNSAMQQTVAEEQQSTSGEAAIGRLQVSRQTVWIALLLLCAGLLISWIVYVQWTTVLSSYMQSLGISLKQYSLLWTLNGALILFGQPLISWVIRRFAKTLISQMLLGSYVFALSMLILTQTTAYAGFFAAMFIMTLGEMLVWPAVPTVAAQFTPAGQEGFIQGLVTGTGSAGRMLGPLLGAVMFQEYSAQGLLYIMTGLALVSVGFFALHHQFVKRSNKPLTPKPVAGKM
ncbi:MFS transporter [Brevibacillus invocatus]|uniref:MFS transporter n=1 Tax=Brevibacillus invocatus TaxID=173959 RepID=UPI00203FA5B0|nr:MFS transporter [Brevibacillus invocatus]MCM3078986.1 MFS transporter [Brevibacillus invocatus]MCM3432049.1 MFS transporter [Brevibacillus invocatus]